MSYDYKIYKMNEELVKRYAYDLLKDNLFEISPSSEYLDLGGIILLNSNNGLDVIFSQDRGESISCLIGKDLHSSPSIEDLFEIIGLEKPKPQTDFLEMMQNHSKLIVENINKINDAFNRENYKNTMKEYDVICEEYNKKHNPFWKPKI